jgi:hypothetical protein
MSVEFWAQAVEILSSSAPPSIWNNYGVTSDRTSVINGWGVLVDESTAKIKAIRQLLDSTAQTIRRDAAKIYSRELAEMIFVQPYCRIGNLVDAGIAQRQSASTYLKRLCEIGVLEERKAGREKLFINPAFLRLLTRADVEKTLTRRV